MPRDMDFFIKEVERNLKEVFVDVYDKEEKTPKEGNTTASKISNYLLKEPK